MNVGENGRRSKKKRSKCPASGNGKQQAKAMPHQIAFVSTMNRRHIPPRRGRSIHLRRVYHSFDHWHAHDRIDRKCKAAAIRTIGTRRADVKSVGRDPQSPSLSCAASVDTASASSTAHAFTNIRNGIARKTRIANRGLSQRRNVLIAINISTRNRFRDI